MPETGQESARLREPRHQPGCRSPGPFLRPPQAGWGSCTGPHGSQRAFIKASQTTSLRCLKPLGISIRMRLKGPCMTSRAQGDLIPSIPTPPATPQLLFS